MRSNGRVAIAVLDPRAANYFLEFAMISLQRIVSSRHLLHLRLKMVAVPSKTIVRNKVMTKASNLSNDAARIFLSVWKSKKIPGKVLRLDKGKPNGSTRNATFITCKWILPGRVITKELNGRSVEYVPPGKDVVPVAVAIAPGAAIDTDAHNVPNTRVSTAQAD